MSDRRPMTTRRWIGRVTRWLAALLLAVGVAIALLIPGCTNWIAHAIVDAPNSGKPASTLHTFDDGLEKVGIDQKITVDVGPPSASLCVWIIEPMTAADHPAPPKGTVLVLHGVRDGKRSQVSLGKAMAGQGYRAILLDLRGHGESTGDWLTYGVVESHDLVQVLDALTSHGLLAEPVAAIGTSYGAAVAIQHAAIDSRVKAIIAVATFTSLNEIVPHYAATYGMGWALTQATLDKGIARASLLSGVDLNQASPLRAIALTQADILLIHGEADDHIPHQHSVRLKGAAGSRGTLLLLKDDDHVSIGSDRSGRVQDAMMRWLDEHMAAQRGQ